MFASINLTDSQTSRCEKWLKESCYDTTDSINCEAAWNFCSNIAYSFQATGECATTAPVCHLIAIEQVVTRMILASSGKIFLVLKCEIRS